MLLHISEQSSATLQEQILVQIRARILSNELATDFALPSIRGLAKDLKVSVITVQRAYDTLLNEGLIYARRGKGFYVAALPESDRSAVAVARFETNLQQLLDAARRDGLDETQLQQIFTRALRKED
ncbi:MAG: GntR family transcriptional regulator [Gammaproteobacteria bacterium]